MHINEVPDTKVQVLKAGEVIQEVTTKPYYVKQTPGYALGYDIVEFDPNAEENYGRQPSFEAVKLELEPGSYQIRVVDSSGQVVKGSVRDIRSVNAVPDWQLYLISLLPLMVGVIVAVRRRRLRIQSAKPMAV